MATCACGVVVEDRILEQGVVKCSCGRWFPMQDRIETIVSVSPQELWLRIHSYPFTVKHWIPVLAREHHAKLWGSLPVNCECRKHSRRIMRRLPPDYSTREAYFEWGVEFHNRVNDILGKPRFPLEDAYRLYKPT